MSRFLSHLAELQPELFAEMSPELARELKIDNGDYISIVSLRGAIEARALVSRRMRPMHLDGKTVHQIAMPFHFGSAGPVKGGATNDLIPISGEPNVTIMEAKALRLQHRAWPIAARTGLRGWIKKYVPKGGPPICIRNNRRRVRRRRSKVVVTAQHGKIDSIDDRRRHSEHESAAAPYVRG